MRKILFDGISMEDFFVLMRESIHDEIHNTNQPFAENGMKSLLTREQTCSLLHISLPTFHRWCRQGKLRVHKVGGRVLVKKEDVDACLLEIQTTNQQPAHYFNAMNQKSFHLN